jgi:hypothetical protein
MDRTLKVECYAGYKADQRPVRFSLHGDQPQGGPSFEVIEILEQWYGPDHQGFKVLADDNNVYVLRHHPSEAIWTLDTFTRSPSRPA